MNQDWFKETDPFGCKEEDTPARKPTDPKPQTSLTPTEENCETTTFYLQLDWHAAGGLGVIFKARDRELRRDVALKFIRDKSVGGSGSSGTFENEARITAQLGHPGVVPIYGIGKTREGDRPFYAMRFIEGRKLSQVISEFHNEDRRRGRRLNPQSPEFRKLLSRMVFVCNTVQHAHHRGVIHLDIKPDNVMVGQFDETLVVDWGLAAKVSRDEMRQHPVFKSIDSDLTDLDSYGPKSTGEGPGTPAYFSPEQARRDAELTFSTDIYLLGATLYHVLTGVAPLADAGSRDEVFMRARNVDYPKPSEARPGVPRELEEICLKATHKNPRDRYATAQEMALDLENYLSDAPVSAHQDRWWEKIFRWSRHHRNLTRSVASLVVVLAVLFGLFAAYTSREATKERMMRENTLRVAGRFAAKGLAEEIKSRWLILEKAAADPELSILLTELKAVAKPEKGEDGADKLNLSSEAAQTKITQILLWLSVHYGASKKQTQASNWYLFDAAGYQVGRFPSEGNEKTVGRNFAFRSHFHGEEVDAVDKQKARKNPAPVKHRFLSSAYRSKADGIVRVAFSIPVRPPRKIGLGESEETEPIAVLGMCIEPGAFTFLDLNKVNDDLDAVLVDTKIANFDSDEHFDNLCDDLRGLVLHHPRLEKFAEESHGQQLGPIGFPEDYIRNRFDKLRLTNSVKNVVSDHIDPIEGSTTGQRMAIYEPVILENSDASNGLGLIVIIQERKLFKGK